MFLQQKTVKVHCLKASFATLLVIGLLFNCLPSVSEAHHEKQTITTITVTTESKWGWEYFKDEAGEPVKRFVEVSRTVTTTSSSYDSVIQHSRFPWATVITAGATFITAVVAIFKTNNPAP